jgi:uncharacterized protein (DUF433 family)
VNRKTFLKAFGYTAIVPSSTHLRVTKDKRDLGRYSIPEAAGFIGMPERTMRRWFLGSKRLFRPSYQHQKNVLLSFNDVTEAYIVDVLRSHYEYSPRRLRVVVEGLRVSSKLDRPLAQREFYAIPEFQSLVDRRVHKGTTVNIDYAHHGNLVFDPFVISLGKRIQRDSKGRAQRIFPWRHVDSEDVPLSIDPDVLSGDLVVSGTRIPATMIYAKKLEGKTAEEIAHSYHLEPELIAKVINHFEREL